MSAGDDHATLGAYESQQCEPTVWESWATAVETAIGHSLDGTHATDGYSLDDAYNLWQQGLSVAAAATHIRAATHRDAGATT